MSCSFVSAIPDTGKGTAVDSGANNLHEPRVGVSDVRVQTFATATCGEVAYGTKAVIALSPLTGIRHHANSMVDPSLHISRRIRFSGEMWLNRLDDRPQSNSQTIAAGLFPKGRSFKL
jgi:hypothetical protein